MASPLAGAMEVNSASTVASTGWGLFRHRQLLIPFKPLCWVCLWGSTGVEGRYETKRNQKKQKKKPKKPKREWDQCLHCKMKGFSREAPVYTIRRLLFRFAVLLVRRGREVRNQKKPKGFAG